MSPIPPEVEAMRTLIDKIDDQIIELVRQRCELAAMIAKIKKEQGVPVYDGIREGLVFNKYMGALKDLGKVIVTALLTKKSKQKELPQPPKPKDS